MALQAGRAVSLGLALCAVVALAGCASSVKRSEEHKSATFKLSAEFPVGRINVSATPEALANIEAAKKKFDPARLKEAIRYSLDFDHMFAKPGQSGLSMDVVVTRVRVRSSASALWWGFMAGNDAVDGEVVVKDLTGKVLDKFAVKVTYAFGGLAGGEDETRVGYLYDAFAQEVVDQYKAEAAGGSQEQRQEVIADKKTPGVLARAGRFHVSERGGRDQPALAGEFALISASTMSEWPFGSTLSQCLTILPSGPIR